MGGPTTATKHPPATLPNLLYPNTAKMSDDEERVTMPFKFVTAGFDARFPNQNQTKHCWQNYVDYHKCVLARGEDFPPCRQFFLSFKSFAQVPGCRGGTISVRPASSQRSSTRKRNAMM